MIRTLAPETRQLVIDAQGEAHRLRHGFLGSEHFLLAAAGTHSTAGAVLRQHGLTTAAVRASLLKLVLGGGPQLDEAALADIGIDLDAVRSRVEATFGAGALDRRPIRTRLWRLRRSARTTHSGHLPPTLRAKACLERAEHEAAGRGHDRIDVEDLVLALMATTGGLWQRVVADVGADAGVIRADLLRVLPDG
jgi:ATP-dependent Clp protease ATP-binding subunit ClpA